MSPVSSTSPAGRHPESGLLRVDHSRIARLLVAALAAASTAACICILRQGHPWIGVGLVPALAPCLWLLWRQDNAGGCLAWRDGAWYWARPGGAPERVALSPDPVVLPLLLQLRWRTAHRRRWHQLWLFPDSADAGDLRRLRRQLRLQG